jgi:two-component system, NtrC family, response regulator HupR/HoxA
MTQAPIQRDPRQPFYVTVAARPPLPGCWSVNISKSGIGLAAAASVGDPLPKEGDELNLEFELPDGGEAIRVRSRIRWRADMPAGTSRIAVSLGATFELFAGDDRQRLQAYLNGSQVRVAVAFATPEELAAVQEALAEEMELHICHSISHLEEAMARGDVSVVLVCGSRVRTAQEAIEHIWARGLYKEDAAAEFHDLAPRVVFTGSMPAANLVELFNQGRLFRALPERFEVPALRAAVRDAARERGVKLEQRRVGLALERALLRQQLAQVEPAPAGVTDADAGFQSAGMRRALELVRTAAPVRIAVLLQGETGTGKEVLARRLHAASPRAAAPFIVQDCGALTETLLDSELFGHAKGAFTGAVADHPGIFLLANGGTIFLDEIENTSPNLQARLLRAIETGDIRAVGGTRMRRVDVRVVAATNRNLAAEVQAGRFRADLFYRLNSFTIDVPPLRERREDVLPLARHFIELGNAAMGRSVKGLSRSAEIALRSFDWPGNVRELRNTIERAVLLTKEGGVIATETLPPALSPSSGRAGPASLKEKLLEVEKQMIRDALAQSGGVVRAAARLLRTDAVTLGRKVRRHGLTGTAKLAAAS